MGRMLGILYRCIAMHLIKKAGFSCETAQTGAVTLIQRLGSALTINIHFHVLLLVMTQGLRRGAGSLCRGRTFATQP